jgi:hypothetical protein
MSQSKRDFLMNKYSVDESVMDTVEYIDPTPNYDYADWVIKNLQNGKITKTDYEKNNKHLDKFHRLKNSPKFKEYLKAAGHTTDINRYEPNQLFDVLDNFGDSKKQEKRDVFEGIGGAEIKYRDATWVVYKVTSVEAAMTLGSNTNWCTANHGHASSYIGRGDLWIFYKNGKPYLQLHPKDRMICDRKDNSFRDGCHLKDSHIYDLLEKLLDDPAIADYFETIIPYVEPSDRYIQILSRKNPKMIMDILRKLMIRRYPELEPKIFEVDPEKVGAEGDDEGDGEGINIARDYMAAFGPRDPAMEPYIIKFGTWAAAYALFVMNGPWPEAEEKIHKLKKSELKSQYLNTLGQHMITYNDFIDMLEAEEVKHRYEPFEEKLLNFHKKNTVHRNDISTLLDYCEQAKYWWPEVVSLVVDDFKRSALKSNPKGLTGFAVANLKQLLELANKLKLEDPKITQLNAVKNLAIKGSVEYMIRIKGTDWIPDDCKNCGPWIENNLTTLLDKKIPLVKILDAIQKMAYSNKTLVIKDFDRIMPLISVAPNKLKSEALEYLKDYLVSRNLFYPELFETEKTIDISELSEPYAKEHLLPYLSKLDFDYCDGDSTLELFGDQWKQLSNDQKMSILGNCSLDEDDADKILPKLNDVDIKVLRSSTTGKVSLNVGYIISQLSSSTLIWPKFNEWIIANAKKPFFSQIVGNIIGQDGLLRYIRNAGLEDITGVPKLKPKRPTRHSGPHREPVEE